MTWTGHGLILWASAIFPDRQLMEHISLRHNCRIGDLDVWEFEDNPGNATYYSGDMYAFHKDIPPSFILLVSKETIAKMHEKGR